jgi:metal-responsive CopG/Arc/MetJ family transcriptional regulator
MFRSGKIKIKKELYERVKSFAEQAGYASVEEFIEHTLEKEISRTGGSDSEDETKKKLRGLGYIS